jgi:hypothetical protein
MARGLLHYSMQFVERPFRAFGLAQAPEMLEQPPRRRGQRPGVAAADVELAQRPGILDLVGRA